MYWSDSGELVCVASDDSFYILQYSAEAAQQALSTNEGIDEDGIEAAFDVRGDGRREEEGEGGRGKGVERRGRGVDRRGEGGEGRGGGGRGRKVERRGREGKGGGRRKGRRVRYIERE